jgi:hypothetical protein
MKDRVFSTPLLFGAWLRAQAKRPGALGTLGRRAVNEDWPKDLVSIWAEILRGPEPARDTQLLAAACDVFSQRKVFERAGLLNRP